MKALEVLINGKFKCRAPLPKDGNISAILSLSSTGHLPKPPKPWSSRFHVGGLEVVGEVNRFSDFLDRSLRTGEEVVLRIVETDHPTKPLSTKDESESGMIKLRKRSLRRAETALKKRKK